MEVDSYMVSRTKGEDGSVLLLTAFALFTLLLFVAMVGTVGSIVAAKSSLQAAADAGALAGASAMGNAKSMDIVRSQATLFAQDNLQPGDTVEPPVIVNNDSEGSVAVTASRQVEISLPGLFENPPTYKVTATAKAKVFNSGSISHAPPFVIQAPKNIRWDANDNYQHSQRYTMQINPQGPNSFTYADVLFNSDTSWQEYYSLLANGYKEECTLKTPLYYLGPAQGGKESVRYFGSRVERDRNNDVRKAKYGDERLMIIPLVDTLPTAKKGQSVKIVGFIGFWLESMDYGQLSYDDYYMDWWGRIHGVGSARYRDFKANGYFVKVTLPAGSYEDYNNRFFGTSQVRLVNS